MRGGVNPMTSIANGKTSYYLMLRCIKALGQKIYINEPEVLELTRKLQQTRTSHSAIYPVLNGGVCRRRWLKQ